MITIETVLSIIVALIVFGVIIFIHELGHFVTAKLFDVQVNEFAIGMGPKLIGWGKGETKYSIRALPVGGYCAMEGEDGDETDEHGIRIDNPRAFNRKKKWQRAIILVAGATMNIILGFVIMFFITVSQPLLSSTQIASFDEAAVSNTSVDGGDFLQERDKILRINNVNVHVGMDLSYALMLDRDGVVDILVERNGERVQLKSVTFNMVDEQGTQYTTIDFRIYGTDNALTHLFTPNEGVPAGEHVKEIFVSLGRVFRETWYSVIATMRTVWTSLIDLMTGVYGLKDLSGPVGTTQVMTQAVSAGFDSLLLVAMFITVNLGIFNLLPFPALDGGRIVLLGLEAIRRKPLPKKVEAGINAAGLIILLALVAVVTVSDIIKMFTSG